ncbi:MAG: hypothetical protein M3R16_11255, partial [Pseudomonadota bacterium]|nr:hypothetical protein [Pseudomonadota bacterium]
MTEFLAKAIVVLTGAYFIALAVASLFVPAQATRFLLGFAQTPSAHYVELLVRFVVGGAFVLNGPLMSFPGIFTAFGWVLVMTTIGLLLVP